MDTTSASLLDRLRAAAPDHPDWRRLHDLYVPFMRKWLAQCAGLTTEADDLAQEVFLVVVRELPAFRRQRDGSFRAWLRAVTVNRVRTHRRARVPQPIGGLDPADRFLNELGDPGSDLSKRFDQEHDRHVFQRLLAVVRPDFEPKTWEAFNMFAIDDRPVADVAAATGLTDNAVMLAKSRVLRRLRQEAAGLMD